MDVCQALEAKKIPFVKDRDGEIRLHCASGEHEDKNPSLRLNLEKGVFRCWSCGKRGNVQRFMQMYGLEVQDELEFAMDDVLTSIRHIQEDPQKVAQAPVDFDPRELWACGRIQDAPKPYRAYLDDRQVGKSEFDAYHILYCDNEKSRLNKRIIIPVFDEGRMVGFMARAIDNRQPKYLYSQHFKKNDYLWNAAKGYAYRSVLIVEGAFDAIRAWQALRESYQIMPVAMLGGAELGEGQINQLVKMGVERVYLGLDKDKAGTEMTQKIFVQLNGDFEILFTGGWDGSKDIGGATHVAICTSIYNAVDSRMKFWPYKSYGDMMAGKM
jgi:DNA primase